ncbi:hypothetical protein IQ235_00210 [Oscillatoriales cyanobacterium LEGE 11467]|uniref:Uncharacterized protein n=2 Tax=Zarconia TaxID=2992130 RepID=A0A928Z722_9CYAN|nr:hypothetical protein [Zarconia navalis LEGE 11467]
MPIAIVSLLFAIGLGWLVKSFLIVLGLLVLTPFILALGLQWWIGRNLVQDRCPVCEHPLAGLANTPLQCPSCGEALQVKNGGFERSTPPGTIDVDAVDVSVIPLKESQD